MKEKAYLKNIHIYTYICCLLEVLKYIKRHIYIYIYIYKRERKREREREDAKL